MPFSLFDAFDAALINQEKRVERASTVPAVWPSEASATRIDLSQGQKIVGKCMRASFYRMTGKPITEQIDAIGAWRWITGRMMEGALVDLAKITNPNIYVASGVRAYVADIYLPLEIDVVTIDPKTGRAWLGECKTYYGYYAKKEIETQGRPKLENILQVLLYLIEIKDGIKLKQVIKAGLQERERLEAAGARHRNRIEANLEQVERIADGPVGAKLLYMSRDEVARKEFEIGIAEDFDGSHYPTVDGQMWKIFTVESVYERYKQLQAYWFKARKTAMEILAAAQVLPPDTLQMVLVEGQQGHDRGEDRKLSEEQIKAENDYIARVEDTVHKLPTSFLPPAEYEYAYSPDKIEDLNSKGLLTKKAYTNWKKQKPGFKLIGDWQCRYCAYKAPCTIITRPDLAYIFRDIEAMKQAEGDPEAE